MEKVFNKLVRDNIPYIISSNGEESVTRVLEDEEYKKELYKKLLEEANEVISSKGSDETIEELADVLEILSAIAKLNGKKLDDVVEVAKQKKLKRGGFEKRLFLEKTYKKIKGVDPNERK
ncbi:MAG: nucleoside triphosphate pyrophosphohydrolase [Clostridia bacterium]|nr:nucleoside triphosphate pyrophosphohydrolase [Clostridia bacterium]